MASQYSNKNLVNLYNTNQSSLYQPSIYGNQTPDDNSINRSPFIWVTPNASNLDKYLEKNDTNSLPEGAVARDTVRVGKFLTSGKGLLFLATQTALQGQNVFNETSLYNPASIPLTIVAKGSAGILGAPTRFIDLNNPLNSIVPGADLLFGISNNAPNGTLSAALPRLNADEGAGLQRSRTANTAFNNFSQKYSGQQTAAGFLSQLASSLLPNLAPLVPQSGTYKVGDTTTYDTMVANLSSPTSMFSYFDVNGNVVLATQNYTAPSSTTNAASLENILPSILSGNISAGNSTYSQALSGLGDLLNNSSTLITGKKLFPSVTGLTGDGFNVTSILDAINPSGENSNASYRGSDNDLIAFYFYDIVNSQFIPFRATLTTIDMENNTSWSPVRYIGRADRIYIYEGMEKTISFSFKVYANSPEELAPMWSRINYLVSLSSPADYTSGPDGSNFIVPPFIKLTIGDLYKNLPITITSVNITVPEESSWELTADASQYSYLQGKISRQATVGQLPMYIEISVSANVLEKYKPRAGNLQFSDVNTNVGNAIKGPKAITSDSTSGGLGALGGALGALGGLSSVTTSIFGPGAQSNLSKLSSGISSITKTISPIATPLAKIATSVIPTTGVKITSINNSIPFASTIGQSFGGIF